jgi:hypothetical protein
VVLLEPHTLLLRLGDDHGDADCILLADQRWQVWRLTALLRLHDPIGHAAAEVVGVVPHLLARDVVATMNLHRVLLFMLWPPLVINIIIGRLPTSSKYLMRRSRSSSQMWNMNQFSDPMAFAR